MSDQAIDTLEAPSAGRLPSSPFSSPGSSPRSSPRSSPCGTRSAAGATLVLVLPLLSSLGCASTGNEGFWPDRHEWSQALGTATRSAATWGPAAAAAAIAVSGRDDDLAAWAARETPLFGSTERALAASDDLRLATHVAMTLTALATEADEHRWRKRIERLLVENGAAVATTTVTRGLKELTHRTRPDGADDLSFPSGHASRSFAYSAAARRNLRFTRLRPGLRRGLGFGIDALAAGTAWARVEGGVHYPSDVLAGAALGNFVAVLVHDAFFDSGPEVTVIPSLTRDHLAIAVHLRIGGRPAAE